MANRVQRKQRHEVISRYQTRYCQACLRLGQFVIAEIQYSSEFYSCLGGNEYHYFCRQHMWLIKCPVHRDGQVFCEVNGCYKVAMKYSNRRYECLSAGEFHFFCQSHARNNCPQHPQYYIR